MVSHGLPVQFKSFVGQVVVDGEVVLGRNKDVCVVGHLKIKMFHLNEVKETSRTIIIAVLYNNMTRIIFSLLFYPEIWDSITSHLFYM